MPSPFPGMDPWLERPAVFPDFHTAFITTLRVVLNAQLPPPFYAGVSTRVWMEESERRVEPDVDVLKPSNGPAAGGAAGGGVALLTGTATALTEIVAPLPDEEMRERYVEIFAAPGEERLVNSIEMLSPSNKTPGSGGRDLYRAKQQEMYQAAVHLIEIDLLRGGTHATLVPLEALRRRFGAYDYHICLHHAGRPDSFFVRPLTLPDRLPVIPVWLTDDVPPVPLDLQVVFDRCYDEALYARRVRYHEHRPEPPLTDEQARWAEDVLRARGLLGARPG